MYIYVIYYESFDSSILDVIWTIILYKKRARRGPAELRAQRRIS